MRWQPKGSNCRPRDGLPRAFTADLSSNTAGAPPRPRCRRSLRCRAFSACDERRGTSHAAPATHQGRVAAPVENDAPVELPDSSARSTHIIAGAATTLVWYGVAVGHSYLWSDNPGAEELRLPVVGPWLSLGKTGCPKDEPDCSTVLVVVQAVLTTLTGVGQVGGLAIIGEGLFVPTRSESKSQSSKPTGASRERATVHARA